jgi:hypothetical protein
MVAPIAEAVKKRALQVECARTESALDDEAYQSISTRHCGRARLRCGNSALDPSERDGA